MRLLCLVIAFMFGFILPAESKGVLHKMKTEIGVFDACEQTFEYAFFSGKDYDITTTLKTTGTFGVLYPFKAMYHAVGIYDKSKFYPQDYFYETDSFKHRTKEIVYQNGVPIYRISTKNEVKRKDEIKIEEKYETSNDLLSVMGELTRALVDGKKCDFAQFSFNGKKYTKVTSEYLGKEKIITPYFKGRAMKCRLNLEILDDAEAGFLLDKKEPIYFWVLKDKKSGFPFVVKVFVKSTPLGELESLTTEIEVKNAE